MGKYRKNWQFAETKEIIGFHEAVSPYDWALDIELNPNFKLWAAEYKEYVNERKLF